MIQEKLRAEKGIPENCILNYRFDSMEYADMTAKDMFIEIKSRLSSDGKTDLFLDEVQEIPGWETVYGYLEKLEKAYLIHRCS